MIQPPLPLSSGIHWNMNIPKFYINQRIQYVVFFVCILLLSIVILKLTKFKKRILFIFQEVGREKERERNINRLPLTRPHLGTWPATQPFALTRNPNGDRSVHRPALNPLSHTSQALTYVFRCVLLFITFYW